ncbi:hypothetical protein ACP3XL_01410 [Vibrio anguillarum]
MLNREIFVNDPVSSRLANNGVAQVKDDLSKGALDTLEYELQRLSVMVRMPKAWTVF